MADTPNSEAKVKGALKIEANLLKLDARGASEFATKLLATISTGIAGFAQPYQIRRVALANADAKRIAAEAEADAKVSHERGDIRSIELRQRAFTRLVEQEQRRQENIENVVRLAVVEDREVKTQEPVDQDWIASFLEGCQDISNVELQKLWASLLATEVTEGGRISRLLLNAVKLMSPTDARNFAALTTEVFSLNVPFNRSIEKLRPSFFVRDVLRSSRTLGFELDVETLAILGLVSAELFPLLANQHAVTGATFYGQSVFFRRTSDAVAGAIADIHLKTFTTEGEDLFHVIKPNLPPAIPSRIVQEFRARGLALEIESQN